MSTVAVNPGPAEAKKILYVSYVDQRGINSRLAIEQIPGGYQMPFATVFNFWQRYGHMQGRVYATVEALLDDAAPGWQSWQEYHPLPILTKAQETTLIRAALKGAGLQAKGVRHYLGPVIIEMGRQEAHEGEFLQIEELAWQALETAEGFANGCRGIHVVESWHGKQRAGYERFRRYK